MCTVRVILFDFGGVLADEGFREGLQAIGRRGGVDPEAVFSLGQRLVHETGYLLGKGDEASFWRELRRASGVEGSDESLRAQILSRFVLRDWMLDLVRELKGRVRLGILSDQTDWLDELNARDDFFRHFEVIFNSYHMGKGKHDPTHFIDVLRRLALHGPQVLFIDDSEGHCLRARQAGMEVIHYEERDAFLRDLARYCPFLGMRRTGS
jgi:putative hydrolase of the HAD superfamily